MRRDVMTVTLYRANVHREPSVVRVFDNWGKGLLTLVLYVIWTILMFTF